MKDVNRINIVYIFIYILIFKLLLLLFFYRVITKLNPNDEIMSFQFLTW